MKNKTLEINELYRLPWSKNDNPNGWLEITTFCNMKCPGCYRGCNRSDNKQEHFPLERLKKEILMLKKIRNCQTITISGGEPLIHPQILEIVRFIKKEGMIPSIFTNGRLLTREFLLSLKEAGLISLNIRVDSNNMHLDESSLNKVRQQYSSLVNSVKGIVLGFVCVITSKNIKEIHCIVEWFKKNQEAEVLDLIAFRPVIFSKKEKLNMKNWVYIPEICSELWKKFPDLRYSSYLGSQLEDAAIKWLYSFDMHLGKKHLGYLGKKFHEVVQSFNHLKKGRYLEYLNKKEHFLSLSRMIQISLIDKSMRFILLRYMAEVFKNPINIFKKPHLQAMVIIQPPGLVNGKRDLCDSCPDVTLYNGKLYPSCGLEEIKRFGKLYEIRGGKNVKYQIKN